MSQIVEEAAPRSAAHATSRPRLAFLGTGWIGHNRLKAVAQSGLAEIVAIADPSPDAARAARETAPDCELRANLEELLSLEPDGVVIATPTACHAAQSIAALNAGAAVFCQKPLGCDARETEAAIQAARRNDRLLAVDYSYRHTSGLRLIRDQIRAGGIGRVFAVDLAFHNAYGPDKAWYYDRRTAGGGCLSDLGVHLVDTALWCLGPADIDSVRGRLYGHGRRLPPGTHDCEDFATAEFALCDGAEVRIASSWRAHAGCDALIHARFWGSDGALSWENVNGSFFDFRTVSMRGTAREVLSEAREDWGPGAILAWVDRLSRGARYDPEIETSLGVAAILDRVHGRATRPKTRQVSSGF